MISYRAKRIINRIITVIIIIGILILIPHIFDLSPLNEPLNKWLRGEPKKYCNRASDCVIRPTNCSVCNCGDAVNKNWKPFCPFKSHKTQQECNCPKYIVRCINHRCRKYKIS